MLKKIFCITATVILLYSANTFAARPLSTDDCGIANKGDFGIEISRDFKFDSDKNYQHLTQIVPTFGLSEKNQISIEVPFLTINPSDNSNNISGICDINMALKSQIYEGKGKIPSLLLRSNFKFSNGNTQNGFGSGDNNLGFTLISGLVFGNSTINLNLGYVFTGNQFDSESNNFMIYGISIEHKIINALTVALDFYTESSATDSEFDFKKYTISPTAGLSYCISDMTVIDIGFSPSIQDTKLQNYKITGGIGLSF